MKKISLILLAVLMLALCIPTYALTANGSLGNVPLYKGGITIDGKLDEAYNKGLKLDINADYPNYATKCNGTAYLVHDGTYLYIFCDVNNVNKLTEYNPKYATELYKTTDVQLSFDFSNDAKTSADMYKVNIAYNCKYYYGEFLAKPEADLKSLIADLKSTYNLTTNNYKLETKIKLQEGAKTGSEIGLYIMYISDPVMNPTGDSAMKEAKVPYAISGSNNANLYKNVTLSSTEITVATTAAATTKAAATAAAAKTTAAKTADSSVVIASVIVAAAAAAVVLKKKH